MRENCFLGFLFAGHPEKKRAENRFHPLATAFVTMSINRNFPAAKCTAVFMLNDAFGKPPAFMSAPAL